MSRIAKFLSFITCAFCLWCCKPESGADTHSDWMLTQMQSDSIFFSETHHYNTGTNFILMSDSLTLLLHPGGWPDNMETTTDSCVLKEGDDFVVTEIYRPDNHEDLGIDSVWLCVASDGIHLGWVAETEMLAKSSPVSPISQFIYTFSDTHLYVFIVLIVLMAVFIGYSKYKHMLLWFVHFRDATSLYPCAFTITMATASMIYSTLQKFFPEVWVTYYFNPSLNPFTQPVLVSLFLVSLWLSVLFLLSVVFDLVDKIPFFQMVSYTLSLVCLGCIIYLVLTFSVPYYIGYVFYSLYVFFSVSRFLKSRRT